ncbi:MAG: phosphatase PAP2 family protein [Betaproteobacteria bacterium]|nr:MAG: phosphatase PAP2 family protein [Betaproteobacteria bacterium]
MTAARAAAEPRPWKQGLLWLAFLGPFFFASYGFSNWLAERHGGVGTIAFAWERSIPFLPWTIVPYWLIDLLYALSLLLCASRRALGVHVRRLLAAQIIAVACFLAFPLRFSFERPAVDGAFGWMFAALASFDRPFNQAPSLHIALLVILWGVYLRAAPRWAHAFVHAGFGLIGLSVLTTWQHHFIDLPTGAWLGAFCVWLFPDTGRPPLAACALARDRQRLRLARNYALAALALAALGAAGGGVALWLAWPAGSLLLVALVYAFFGEQGFQKRADGTMPAAARMLLGPYLVGAWLNSRWWTRAIGAAHEIHPGVWVGRIPGASDLASLRGASIVDVCAELPCSVRPAGYDVVPMLDLVAPSGAQIERAAAAVERERRTGPVLICCALGFSRSATAAAAWLVHAGVAPCVDAAIERVRAARPGIVLGDAHVAALRAWERDRGLRARRDDTGRIVPPVAIRAPLRS